MNMGNETPFEYLGEADLLIEKDKYKCRKPQLHNSTIPYSHGK
jgi:hypothetical protein